MDNLGQTLLVESGYVLVERPPRYEVDLSDQSARLLEISELCEQIDCCKVLIMGQRTSVKLSTIDVYNLGEQIAELGLQVAVVELHDAPDADVRFLEEVVTNRGGPRQFFDDEQNAKAWLGVN